MRETGPETPQKGRRVSFPMSARERTFGSVLKKGTVIYANEIRNRRRASLVRLLFSSYAGMRRPMTVALENVPSTSNLCLYFYFPRFYWRFVVIAAMASKV